jgi:hypothetical protein
MGFDPEETSTRSAYDLIAEGFGGGFDWPLVVTTVAAPGVPAAILTSAASRR